MDSGSEIEMVEGMVIGTEWHSAGSVLEVGRSINKKTADILVEKGKANPVPFADALPKFREA